jgi:hypothetical protein
MVLRFIIPAATFYGIFVASQALHLQIYGEQFKHVSILVPTINVKEFAVAIFVFSFNDEI